MKMFKVNSSISKNINFVHNLQKSANRSNVYLFILLLSLVILSLLLVLPSVLLYIDYFISKVLLLIGWSQFDCMQY